ncbi:putative cyclophilin-type peptidyl-prolyl cis-trans isomerase [Cellvibrio sp. BR]|uniref:peptidylprolyl isomerase n=1 Tax=Cellvibrio sp. BR TaxID=1134474 RepID=UPI0002600E02|nr:peptidylprolyl isomerase [Cellvibrio sp. BR]EIK45087.1 putative cyclophilin-type peptidyl-prolyl cis-trans isomerase [Cellvibrio sp. BR]
MRFNSIAVAPFTLLKHTIAAVCLSAGVLMSQLAAATTVQFQTVMGDFEVNLYDKTTPKTVANFLAYVNANAYANTVIHRSVSGFIVQGGGFKYVTTDKLEAITKNAAVENEPVYSNVRATISMAKTPNNANSATNQWFINLADNSSNLDRQNGGFTAFGEVTSGMDVVLAIAGVTRFNFNSDFTELPLRNYSADDYKAKKPVTDQNFVMIENVVVLNADPDTATSLNPPKNTLITEKDDGGSGSLGLLSLLALGLLALGRKTLLNKA